MGATDIDNGAGADDTAAALHEQMTARHAAGDLAGALAVAEQLLAESQQRLGPQHPDGLSLAVAIANWRQHLGDLATAAQELGRLLPLLESELGVDHVDTVSARHMLASYAGPTTDPLAALITWLQLFAVEQRIFGAEHETTLGARHNVAIWRHQIGDVVGAVDEMAQVAVSRGRSLGEAHPDTLVSRLASATWRGDAGDTGAAVAELTALVPLLGKAFGYDQEQTLTARQLCILWGQDLERRELEAVADWTVLVDEELRALGVDHPLTVAAQTELAARRADWEARLDEGEWVDTDLFQQMEIDRYGAQPSPELAARGAEYATKHRGQVLDLLESIIGIKQEMVRRSREFDDDSEPMLSARFDLTYALWSGGEYSAAEIANTHLLDDCRRVLGEHHELTVAVRQIQAAGRQVTQFPLGGGATEPPGSPRDDEPDSAFPTVTVSQMNEIRRYAAETLAEKGSDAVLSADGTAFVRPDGFVCPLHEVVIRCREQPPDQWRAVVTDMFTTFAEFAESVSDVDTMEWPELSERVRARVVSSAEVEQADDKLSYAWPLADGLHEVLCIDFPGVVSYMNTTQVARHDVERLREAARSNTRAEPISGVTLLDDKGAAVHVLYGASSFVASKILDIEGLVPDYIRDTSRGVVVGAPARNWLVLHPVETTDKLLASIEVMCQVCPHNYKEFPGQISPNLYFWKSGVLERISRDVPETGQSYVEFSGALAAAFAELAD